MSFESPLSQPDIPASVLQRPEVRHILEQLVEAVSIGAMPTLPIVNSVLTEQDARFDIVDGYVPGVTRLVCICQRTPAEITLRGISQGEAFETTFVPLPAINFFVIHILRQQVQSVLTLRIPSITPERAKEVHDKIVATVQKSGDQADSLIADLLEKLAINGKPKLHRIEGAPAVKFILQPEWISCRVVLLGQGTCRIERWDMTQNKFVLLYTP